MEGSICIAPSAWIEDWYIFFGVKEGLGNMTRRHLVTGMMTTSCSMNNWVWSDNHMWVVVGVCMEALEDWVVDNRCFVVISARMRAIDYNMSSWD